MEFLFVVSFCRFFLSFLFVISFCHFLWSSYGRFVLLTAVVSSRILYRYCLINHNVLCYHYTIVPGFMEEHIESLRLSRAGRGKKAAFGSFLPRHDRVFSIQLSDLNTMCVESSHVPMSSAVRVFRQITGSMIFVRFLCYAILYLILLYLYWDVDSAISPPSRPGLLDKLHFS